MKIRMAKSHGAYRPGQVIEVDAILAQSLIAWEYATEVRDDQKSLIETASVEPVAESADVTPRKRRRP